MSTSDLTIILEWFLFLFGVGLIFLPLTTRLFNNFFDQGYALSKILGLLLISYTSWFMSSVKIWPFGFYSIWLIIGIFFVINRFVSFSTPQPSFKKMWNIYLFEEILFLGGILFWSYVRSSEPSIHGLEKFMDYGFMNSILRTTYMPPKDLWFTPLSINYYYFGHFWSALLMKAGNFNPDIAYNLVLATILGFSLSSCFSLGGNLFHLFTKEKQTTSLKYIFIAGIVSTFLVNLGGNLQTIYAFFQNYPVPENPIPFWQLPIQFNFDGYWYPNATRFIPFTIHEFPIYSYVVADLHGHVLNIPFVTLFIGVIIKIFNKAEETSLADKCLIGLMLAVFLMTNVLDGPIYLLIISLVFIFKNSQTIVKDIFLVTLLLIFFSIPFFLSFKPFASGIGVLCAPEFLVNLNKVGPFLFEQDHCQKSPIWMLSLLWGFFYFVLFGFIFYIIKNNENFSLNIFKNFDARHITEVDKLVLILSLGATLLILIPEFFYAKDIYPTHYRANTVFKFGYQAFIIFGVICGYMITRLIASKRLHFLYAISLFILFFLVAIYPYFAIRSYYNSLKPPHQLNGFKYFETLYPNDYKAIIWLRENIKGQPVILEAQGDSYTDFARVSTYTGLPTVLGWPVHEWLWRGSYDIPAPRIKDVELLYTSQDLQVTKNLLNNYKVEYVFIGDLESQKFTNLNSGKFDLIGSVVFQSGNTKIYRIN